MWSGWEVDCSDATLQKLVCVWSGKRFEPLYAVMLDWTAKQPNVRLMILYVQQRRSLVLCIV